jgi:DNA-binding transcriptional regulator YhcF (GntR family)
MQQKKELKPLEITIDARSALPVYEQVKQGIKILIISGYLEAGDRLVPIRELASKLKVNPNTIVKVYYQLDVEGYIYSQPGSGYFVQADRPQRPEETEELFVRVTEEFISKALKLGYSVDDMIGQLEKRVSDGKEVEEG